MRYASKRVVPLLLFCVCGIDLHLVAARAARANDQNSELLNRILAQWNSQKSSIFTAAVRFRIFRSGDSLRPLNLVDLQERIKAYDLEKNPDAMREFVLGITSLDFSHSRPWSVMTFRMSGDQSREDTDSGDVQITSQEGKFELDPRNRQVQIFSPTGSRRGQMSLKGLRLVPLSSPDWLLVSSDKSVAVLKTNGRSKLEGHVDAKTGAVFDLIERRMDGRVRSLVAQRGFASYPGDVLFPFWTVRATFNDSEILESIDIKVIESASFNVDVPEETFKLPADSGITVIDARTPGQERSFRLTRATDDVGQASNDPLLQGPFVGATPTTAAHGTIWHFVVANIGILLIFLGFWLLRRKFRRSSST